MKIICIADRDNYGLVIGEEYVVYGIAILEGDLHYLTMGKGRYDNYPDWYPADLFSVCDKLLPLEWYFNYFGDSEKSVFSAIWGYQELVFEETHYVDLIERRPSTVKTFLKRKKEIEEFM